MSNIIMMNRPYSDENAIKDVILYCMDARKLKGMYALGVDASSYESIVESMQYMRDFLDKSEGKQLCHFVITVDTPYYDRKQSEIECGRIITSVCELIYKEGYQICGFLHNNSNVIHAHFVMNTVNLKTGKLLSNATQIMYNLHKKLIQANPHLDMRGVLFNRTFDNVMKDYEGFAV